MRPPWWIYVYDDLSALSVSTGFLILSNATTLSRTALHRVDCDALYTGRLYLQAAVSEMEGLLQQVLHCPKCTNQLEECLIAHVEDINSRWWKCVRCDEFYQIAQLKELILRT